MIEIDGRTIGPGAKSFIIAEVAQAHDGSLGLAHSFIDAVAVHGADAVKFQTHIADAESTPAEPFRIPFSYEDNTRYEYWKRMEFTPEQWAGLADHCRQKQIVFLSSVFSVEAIALLDRIGVPALKFGSGEVHNSTMLDAGIATGKPLLLSSGMSTYEELDDTVSFLRSKGAAFALFQATSKYPTPLTEVGLNNLDYLRTRYGVPTGLSDHSASIWPTITAIGRGADLVEFHVTFDRTMFGPDSIASLTFAELAEIVSARDAIATMDSNPVDKSTMARDLGRMRQFFRKSVALKEPQRAGTRLEAWMLTGKKPASGIPFDDVDKLVGRVLLRDVEATRLLTWDDVGQ